VHRTCAPLAVIALLAVGANGCGRSGPERFAVGGQVTLDGAPLPDGEIVFRPDPSTSGPTAAGRIENGAYFIPVERGPVAGKYSVSITAERPTGRRVRADILGEATAEQTEQYLPPQYNERTTLEATIDQDRDDLGFELSSGG
jgi:hypothetical protein